MNTTSVLHLTVRDNGSHEVSVYHVPDAKIDRDKRRELANSNGEEVDSARLNLTFGDYKVTVPGPVVGNISHVYWFTDTLPSDSF